MAVVVVVLVVVTAQQMALLLNAVLMRPDTRCAGTASAAGPKKKMKMPCLQTLKRPSPAGDRRKAGRTEIRIMACDT
jgi:hypothetical protein